MDLPYSRRRAEGGDAGTSSARTACRVLPAADRVLRLRRARRRRRAATRSTSRSCRGRGARTSARRAAHRHPREDLELAADRPERHPARREGDRRLSQLDARGARGESRRLRGGDPADARRLRRRRLGREHLRRQGRRHLHARPLRVDPARHHARLGHPDRAGSRPPRRREDADPHRSLSRRRGVHVRHRRRGDADPRGRRPGDRPARRR